MKMKVLIQIISVCFLFSVAQAKVIYFVPFPGFNSEQVFTNIYPDQDRATNPYLALKKHLESKGHTIKHTTNGVCVQDADYIISLTNADKYLLENLKEISREKCFLVLFEPPVTSPYLYERSLEERFGKIFTMFDDDVDNKQYFKIFYPQPRMQIVGIMDDFSERKLCAMVSNNKGFSHHKCIYYERHAVIDFFAKRPPGEFDLFGGWSHSYRDWKGPMDEKFETLNHYKFSFTYENMGQQNGYITEKIFDSFISGCVPVYIGADNITEYVPAECFIDKRKFSSYSELYNYLVNMDRITYENHIKAIEKFLASDQAQLFTAQHFVKIISSHIED